MAFLKDLEQFGKVGLANLGQQLERVGGHSQTVSKRSARASRRGKASGAEQTTVADDVQKYRRLRATVWTIETARTGRHQPKTLLQNLFNLLWTVLEFRLGT
jgi:hypothetical protein